MAVTQRMASIVSMKQSAVFDPNVTQEEQLAKFGYEQGWFSHDTCSL